LNVSNLLAKREITNENANQGFESLGSTILRPPQSKGKGGYKISVLSWTLGGFGLILLEYQIRSFTCQPAGETFFQASSTVGAKAQNDCVTVVSCRGAVLRRHLCGFSAFTRRRSLKQDGFYRDGGPARRWQHEERKI